MLSFFPHPYPDELLYAILARYHIRSGNNSSKITLKELFNDTNTIATADLPCNIDALIKQLPLLSSYTAEEFINNHTLYQFYAPFLPQQRAITIKQSMKASYGGNIHTRIGIAASSIPMLQVFRFCPDCLKQDEKQYGETYWHRIHQTPGVLVCPHHGTPLHNSSVTFQRLNQHEYEAASPENCQKNASVTDYSPKVLKILLKLAQDIAWLFENPQSPQSLDWYRQRYLNILIDKELATASKRVHQKPLIDEFIFFYGQEILEYLHSMIDDKDHDNWLSSIVRKNRKSFHPIRHLLMMNFLVGSAQAFFENQNSYQPFGKSPWLCFNGAVEHYLQPVVIDVKISHCLENKKPLGTFTCSCGMVYSRTASEKSQDENYRVGKVITYGEIWEKRLQELVEVKKLGLRATARELKVDPRTIKRYVSKLRLNAPWLSHKIKDKLVEVENIDAPREQNRQQWLTLQKDYPNETKTTLRNLSPAVYSWLYRNDKDWLNEHSPALQKPISTNNKVNWLERDKEIKTQVETAVTQLLNREVPDRITISKIGRMTGLKATLEKKLEKLPLTQAYLLEVIATTETLEVSHLDIY
ncbi:MAG: TnsD family transposase [Cyanobacteria bacterium P01_H01_bin.35]